MIGIAYSEAAVEVLDILEHMDKQYIVKIPQKVINFLKENKSETYISNLDHTKRVSEMILKPKTEAILGYIYMNYWANEQEKIEFNRRIEENDRIYKEEMKKKYNPENLFKIEKKNNTLKEKTQIKPVEEVGYLQKIINKIKSFFGRK